MELNEDDNEEETTSTTSRRRTLPTMKMVIDWYKSLYKVVMCVNHWLAHIQPITFNFFSTIQWTTFFLRLLLMDPIKMSMFVTPLKPLRKLRPFSTLPTRTTFWPQGNSLSALEELAWPLPKRSITRPWPQQRLRPSHPPLFPLRSLPWHPRQGEWPACRWCLRWREITWTTKWRAPWRPQLGGENWSWPCPGSSQSASPWWSSLKTLRASLLFLCRITSPFLGLVVFAYILIILIL